MNEENLMRAIILLNPVLAEGRMNISTVDSNYMQINSYSHLSSFAEITFPKDPLDFTVQLKQI